MPASIMSHLQPRRQLHQSDILLLCLQSESKQQASLQRSLANELEWVRSNAQGQQKKGKARMRRYEDLTEQVSGRSGSLLLLRSGKSP